MNLYDRIPNNVNLSEDKRLQRALEKWLPNFLSWWHDMGPEGFQQKDVWLRTAVDVGSAGWAHFDYVKMPDYRWGILLAPQEENRKIPFGEHFGEPAWQDVPGAMGYNIRWGIAPDKLYSTYQVWADQRPRLEVRSLTLGQKYYFAIESFNEVGVSAASKPLELP